MTTRMSNVRGGRWRPGAALAIALIAGAIGLAAAGAAQEPPAGRGAAAGRGASRAGGPPEPRSNVGPADRPRVDPVAADRGAHVWAVECVTCHGAKGRGTERGPNLLRSDVVLHDRFGSELGPFLKKGHPTQSGSPSASLTTEQVGDLMHFLRQRILDTLRGSAEFTERNVLTGNARAGAVYFNGPGQCTACHAATGDLAGIGTKYAPIDLQQRMLFPLPARGGGRRGGGGPAPGPSRTTITVTVSAPSAPAVSGVLVQMDDFYVIYRDASGIQHVVKRTPAMTVTVKDPLQAHHELLDRITNDNMHDLVAYLETLK